MDSCVYGFPFTSHVKGVFIRFWEDSGVANREVLGYCW